MQQRPNIIYLVVHDLGRHLGCYGKAVSTPHLDAFAARSLRFDHAFCASPACSPSRMAAMTGLHAHTSGGLGLAHMGWSLRPEIRTLVDAFNDAGYVTAHFGLNHERHAGTNRYQVDGEHDWADWKMSRALDQAIDWLEARPAAAPPFYLNIGTTEVHASGWHRLSETEAAAKYGFPVDAAAVELPAHLPDTPGNRSAMAKFEACIRYMDAQFERLNSTLDRLGLYENSIVVFTTDHGIAGNRAKGTLFDAGTEIALLMRAPFVRPGTTRALVSNLDFAPTLLEAAGLPLPEYLQGRSFLPVLTGEATSVQDAIFTQRNFHGERVSHREGFQDHYDPSRSIRTTEWHYIRHYAQRPEPWRPGAGRPPEAGDWGAPLRIAELPADLRPFEELYHTRDDPHEFRNLADDPGCAEVKRSLASRLLAWQIETDDPALRGEVPVRPEAPGWGDNWPVKGES
ncbi:MAG: hypothetical protein EA425_16825 [Puniceicoccaceae bacterium]|nr:MAG: hypothetical protein EA425_16825 [Puniceicoccaceae bacterium]